MTKEDMHASEVDDGVIAVLSSQFGVDESLVRDIYHREFSDLKSRSRIKSFLPILCGRRVKQIIIDRYGR